ncbi:MAG: acyl-CoA dehydrogenase family protein [Humibacter sp.]
MDYRDSPEEAEYRATLRAWLTENVPAKHDGERTNAEMAAERLAWHRKLYEGGYIGQSWPVEWGGKGLSPTMDAILNEENGNADAPSLPAMVGYIGRALQMFGNDEQRARFIPPTLSGEIQWCQGFSEPGAGSDLASLTTKAVRDGDEYVISGHKMWTSAGQWADWCLVLARTDPDAPKHKGISAFLVPMDSAGLVLQPIVLANGDPETSEVFYDAVRVPASALVGAEGDGWKIAMTTVAYERGPSDVGAISTLNKQLASLERHAKATGATTDPRVRLELARAYVRGEVVRLVALEQLSSRATGKLVGEEGSVAKILQTEASQELAHLSLDLHGADIVTGRAAGVVGQYFQTRPMSVYGGSAQIQRNIIASRILGMPRS